jgi:short subunit dehydrogenase-like uncharacterized protein
MSPPVASEPTDLVLLGATGYVGRLTARQLAATVPDGVRVGLAGRSAERLAALRAELGPAAAAWSEHVVDVADLAALDRLAASTRVLVNAVGPNPPHGLGVVGACVDHGIGYADLTGETLFARRSVEQFHVRAQQTGAKIVHSCGFDSVPSDLGVGLTAAQAAADDEGTLTTTVLHVRAMRGGFSGGSIDSMRQQLIELGDDPGLRRVASDPRALVDTGTAAPPTRTRRRSPRLSRDPHSGRWQAPFGMGGYNRQIVLRSDALLDHAYGPDFGYREVVDTGRGALGAAAAAGTLGVTTAMFAGLAFAPTRAVLDRLLPDPGQGPSEQTRARGHFAVEVDATTTTGARYRTTVAAPYDPGYSGTAVMLGESALALLVDDLPDRSGVLTPMTALGEALAVRLRTQGFTVRTERLP